MLFRSSPRKRQALPTPGPVDPDDVFQSPLRAYGLHSQRTPSGPPDSSMLVDDEDDIFLGGPSPSSSAHFATSSPAFLRTPLRTPVKSSFRDSPQFSPDRPALSVKQINTAKTPFLPVAASVKRNSQIACSTPSRTRAMTPLNVTSSAAHQQGDSLLFDRLAPLAAPRFVLRTPHNRAETDMHLKKQAETMTMLSIRDLGQSDESGYDSDPDPAERTMDQQPPLLLLGRSGGSTSPFSSIKARARTKANVSGQPPSVDGLTRKDVVDDVVAATVSPDGHITKRRVRSRPVSAELLETVNNTPTVVHNQVSSPALLLRHLRADSRGN